ncbi:polysaccharide deacetylase family sporulation protein PdaB [Bacillus smithii]|uniref:polysaccharide deacetylase family sporulation protein PdaB n=1 Tax=Bacillus smithii TaxID=1479 RepID=UPI003D19B835
MNFWYVIKDKRVKQTLLIVIISFFTALLLFTQNILHIPVLAGKEGPQAIYRGEKGIALTFDIGWGDERAEPIINALIKNKVKAATFFLSGSWAERHPDLVKKIADHGYEIGMLGYSYKDYTALEDEELKKEFLQTKETFKKLQLKNVHLFRTPTGHFDKRVIKTADQFGFTIVHWSVNSEDWKNPGVDHIVKNVSKAKNGDIILLHASDSAKQTKKALPLILKTLQHKGKFVTISEMIANGNVDTTLIP